MDIPPGQQGAIEILIEAIEAVRDRGIDRVIVLAFKEDGQPVGHLSNVSDALQRIGLMAVMTNIMINE